MNGDSAVISAAIEYVQDLFRSNYGGHDAEHTMRVYRNAMFLAEQEEELRLCGVPEWFIRLCVNVEYLAPLADSISYAGMIWRLQYYTIHYPV